MEQKEKIKWNELPTKNKIAIYFLIGSFLLFFIAICNISKDNSPQQLDLSSIKSEAFVISKVFMKRYLKAPATADFPSLDFSFSYSSADTIFKIVSYVDAQNSFGAKIRTNYEATMKWNGREWSDIQNWQLIDLKTW